MKTAKRFAIQLDSPPLADAPTCSREALAQYGTPEEMAAIDAMAPGVVLRFGDTYVRRLPDCVLI